MTKLHKITTALLLAAVLLLSGCAEQGNSPAQGTENSSSDSNSSDSTANSNSNSSSTDPGSSDPSDDPENSSDSDSDPDLQARIENFPIDSFTALDGSKINKSEAVYTHGVTDGVTNVIGFDFAFIRYAQPIFYNTFDDPNVFDMIDLQTGRLKETLTSLTNLNYVKVKAGDKLKNGLTVKYADYSIDKYGTASSTKVELDGEITMEGILFSYPKNYDNSFPEGHLEFYADPNKYEYIPIFGYELESDSEDVLCFFDPKREFAVIGDYTSIGFYNFNSLIQFDSHDSLYLSDDVIPDISNIIAPGEYVKVKITIKNISAHYFIGTGGGVYATLVSVEPLA